MNKLLIAAVAAFAATATPSAAATAAAGETRAPAVAGHFYPAKPEELSALVDRDLKDAPTEALPDKSEVVALLVPHAGLEFSGFTAARAFKLVKPGQFDAVIVVGTSHYKELEGAAIYPGAYSTPDGAMAYDAKLAAALTAASPLIKLDASAHKKEHSIEVEVPFLRRVAGKVPLVAMVMNTQDLDAARKIGRAIAAATKGRRVLLVASSDQSHYPSGGVADAVDKTTLAALQLLDPAYFWLTNRFLMNRALPHLAVTYCGEGAVTAVMTAARERGATELRVLAHINSGDVVSERDYTHVVGYAAAAFVRGSGGAAPLRLAVSPRQKKLLLAAARAGLESAVKGGRASAPLSAEPLLNLPAAAFVTLREDGALRGCLGDTEPQDSLFEAMARLGAAVASQDKRFPPVKAEELAKVKVEVSVLSPARPAKAEDIKPGDGVTVEKDGRAGVFLPEVWKELPKKDDFLGELCAQKAGLPRDCWKDPAAQVKVFTADAFSE